MKKPRFRKRYCLILFIFLIVGVGASVVIKSLSGSSVGVIQNNRPSSFRPVAKVETTLVHVSGQFASYSYPSFLSSLAANKAVSPTLVDYNYSYRSSTTSYISISILDIPGGLLSSDNSYQVRQMNPSIYKESSVSLDGSNIPVMTSDNEDGYSKVAFLVSPDYQASVALSNSAGQQDAQSQAAFTQILKSWHWTN
jgi:hypothetical protein